MSARPMNPRPWLPPALGVLWLAIAAAVMAQYPRAERSGGSGAASQHLDSRYAHNHYYYDRGYTVDAHPGLGYGEFRGPDGGRYWVHGGNWYHWDGGRWVVWGAPLGVYVPVLPPYCTTLWWYGIPYYYANETYYVWDGVRGQYQVVAPPEGMEAAQTAQAPESTQLFIYPKNGQSIEQQSKDQYECHRWAAQQTGFDPTASGAAAVAPLSRRDDYLRAQRTCLEGRGYAVE